MYLSKQKIKTLVNDLNHFTKFSYDKRKYNKITTKKSYSTQIPNRTTIMTSGGGETETETEKAKEELGDLQVNHREILTSSSPKYYQRLHDPQLPKSTVHNRKSYNTPFFQS